MKDKSILELQIILITRGLMKLNLHYTDEDNNEKIDFKKASELEIRVMQDLLYETDRLIDAELYGLVPTHYRFILTGKCLDSIMHAEELIKKSKEFDLPRCSLKDFLDLIELKKIFLR